MSRPGRDYTPRKFNKSKPSVDTSMPPPATGRKEIPKPQKKPEQQPRRQQQIWGTRGRGKRKGKHKAVSLEQDHRIGQTLRQEHVWARPSVVERKGIKAGGDHDGV